MNEHRSISVFNKFTVSTRAGCAGHYIPEMTVFTVIHSTQYV